MEGITPVCFLEFPGDMMHQTSETNIKQFNYYLKQFSEFYCQPLSSVIIEKLFHINQIFLKKITYSPNKGMEVIALWVSS